MNHQVNYRKIYEELKRQIESGSYTQGSLLPPEQVLAQRHGVSRPTIASAYNLLQEDGYVEKRRGLGTVIRHNRVKTRYTLGLLLPGAGESEIFSLINDRILKRSESATFDCLWDGTTANNAEIRRNIIHACCQGYIQQQVDGVLFSPLERVRNAFQLNHEICAMLHEASIPVVLIDRDIETVPHRSAYDVLSIDNFNAGCTMAEHLIEQHCTSLYFFSRPDSASSVDLRLAGIRQTAFKHGLPFDTHNVVCGNPEDTACVGSMPIEQGRTGIICANDSTAAVLMSTLETCGVIISRDALVCGYDDMKYSAHLKHALTTYRQPCAELGDMGIEMLLNRIQNPHRLPVSVTLPGQLIVRDSTRFL